MLGFPGGSAVKNLPAMQEMWVWSLGLEDLLEKEMATHSSILAWEIPWREEPGRLQSMELQRVGHDLVTKQQEQNYISITLGASLIAQVVKNLPACRRLEFNPWVKKIPWRRQWLPTPVFLLGVVHEQRGLVGYSPWGRKESDTSD